MTDVEQRPRFYEGQYLEAADLMAAVGYGRSQLSRSLLAGHRWGISIGLALAEVDGPGGTVDVFVQPGYAWDGFGRPILVPEPTKLSAALFAQYDTAYVPGNPPPPPQVVQVWLRYDETMTQGPRPGFESCDAGLAFSRVLEGFQLEVGPRAQLASQRDPVEIAGRTTDAGQALKMFDATAPDVVDADIPHQTLPADGSNAHWLVPLGVVMWQAGNPGSFAKRDDAARTRSELSRQYCGVVAGSVEATAGHVRVHDRSLPYSPYTSDELLWVEGGLRCDGDVRLYGTRLALVRSHTEDPQVPFQLVRTDDIGTGSTTLTVVIGDKNAGDNKLAIGPQTGPGLYAERMVVTDEGHVGIGTSAPKALLHLTEDGLQIGASATPEDNFYLQSNTDGPRGLRVYNKDVGAGVHLATLTQTGRLGVGVTDPTNALHVVAPLGVRQGAMYLSGDSRWSSLTFNAHHSAANDAWVFPDPTKPVVTAEMDAVDGTPRFEVYASPAGNNQAWLSRLRVWGHTGDVTMGVNGGSLGVGTATPGARLDVQGDVRATGEIRLTGANLAPVASSLPLRTVWGMVGVTGAKTAGDGFTSTRTATGRYVITFDAAFLGQPTLVVTKVFGDPNIDAGAGVLPAQNAIVDQILPTSAIVATANETGALTNSNFCFMAIGMR